MPEYKLGNLRRAAAVMTFGPGAVVDFRADGGPVSAVAAGLEEWDRGFPPAGLRNEQRISEARLERKLAVRGFRLPPVVDENWRDKDGKPDGRSLVAAQFPDWLQCPRCDRIAQTKTWGEQPGRAPRFCPQCTARAPGRRSVFVVPVRFVMACEAGHLDDFPWNVWVNHEAGCQHRRDLLLKSERPGLAGLILQCPRCGARRSMDGVFSSETWKGFGCSGRRPWLAAPAENCRNDSPRALQRGASNLYFPAIESALSIPPWSDRLQEALGIYWNTIVETKPSDRADFIRILSRGDLRPALEELRVTPEELARRVEERVDLYGEEAILDIRQEEYRQLTSGVDTLPGEDREFEIRNERVPERLGQYFGQMVRAVRLREVRALYGFTRINPPADSADPRLAPLSVTKLDWLPAVEVRGEGVFLCFSADALVRWEHRDDGDGAVSRAAAMHEVYRKEWQARYGAGDPPRRITPRFVLVHTFAHALMRQLTLECGYSGAALRERLYLSDEVPGMAGLLIYTATSDADGTLGGLQRQGTGDRIVRAVQGAIAAMEWCSSDPLCIEGMVSAHDRLSLAACHACVLAPETACEEFNRFLDRAMLVGLPGCPELGFFGTLLARR